MPVVVTPLARRIRLFWLALPLLALCLWGVLHVPPPLHDDSCLGAGTGMVVCAASDMARITRNGTSRLEHPRYDLAHSGEQRLHWTVARNETIAFQLILRSEDLSRTSQVVVEADSGDIEMSLYQAHYLQISNGGYRWGPATAVLPYPAAYPDALIPQQQQCGEDKTRLFDTVQLPPVGKNQSVWVEMYIPDDAAVGLHSLQVSLTAMGNEQAPEIPDPTPRIINLQLTLDVVDVTLPHTTSIDAIGEVYRSYRLEGVGEDRSQKSWQHMAQCYQVLAHQHRMVFIERTPDEPQTPEHWQNYLAAYAPALNGDLFTTANDYVGTGMNTPVSIWRTPWAQQHDVTVEHPVAQDELERYTHRSRIWTNLVNANDWHDTRYFAYVFDEVDGPTKLAESAPERRQYIARVHGDMLRVQQSIDQGSSDRIQGQTRIDLLWTSHSDPVIWLDDPETTLVNRVRLWAPNAHAANPSFLAERTEMGEQAWFYHSGHPAVGGHSINLPGSDMRSWGVIGARYGLRGQLMWSVNLGNDDLPFAQPTYKPDDDRVGNGVMVYPGYQLPRIGFPAAPGPIPSMRLKAWHRGLQDAELFYLARTRFPNEAQALITALIPRALGEAVEHGDTAPTWPRDAAPWIQWREDLLALLLRQ